MTLACRWAISLCYQMELPSSATEQKLVSPDPGPPPSQRSPGCLARAEAPRGLLAATCLKGRTAELLLGRLRCGASAAGIGSGSGPNSAAGTVGTTVAEIYNASAPLGSRCSKVADSGIWRLYHSWAFLTRNATVRRRPRQPTWMLLAQACQQRLGVGRDCPDGDRR